MCSKSIVYESDNKNIPLQKFKFEYMKDMPQFGMISTIKPAIALNLRLAESLPSK